MSATGYVVASYIFIDSAGLFRSPKTDMKDYDDDDGGGVAAVEAPRQRRIRFNDDDAAEERGMVPPGEEALERGMVPPGEESGVQVDEIQRKMLAMAGQDVDAYMKEMEEVHKKTQTEKAVEMESRLSKMGDVPGGSLLPPPPQQQQMMMMPPGPPPGPPQQMPHHVIMPARGGVPILYRPAPPPLRPGVAPPGVRLPPGPPPGIPPTMPPGPPPGRPPMQPRFPVPHGILASRPQGVLSAAPQINKEATAAAAAPTSSAESGSKSVEKGGVIEAKPQMRNLRSDITRFVPTNVKLRGGVAAKQVDPMTDVFRPPQTLSSSSSHYGATQRLQQHQQQAQQQKQPTKDDAYAQFMQEMDQLLK